MLMTAETNDFCVPMKMASSQKKKHWHIQKRLVVIKKKNSNLVVSNWSIIIELNLSSNSHTHGHTAAGQKFQSEQKTCKRQV